MLMSCQFTMLLGVSAACSLGLKVSFWLVCELHTQHYSVRVRQILVVFISYRRFFLYTATIFKILYIFIQRERGIQDVLCDWMSFIEK